MSTTQLKTEINKVLDHLSDKGLEEVLNLLKRLNTNVTVDTSQHLQKILQEDRGLLERLAK